MISSTIIVYPYLYWFTTDEGDAGVGTVREVRGRSRLDGYQAIDIDSNMVSIDIFKFNTPNCIELDGEDMV